MSASFGPCSGFLSRSLALGWIAQGSRPENSRPLPPPCRGAAFGPLTPPAGALSSPVRCGWAPCARLPACLILLGCSAGYGRPCSRAAAPASLGAAAAAALRGDRLLLRLPRGLGRLFRLGLLLRRALRLERRQVGRGLWDLRPRLVRRDRQHLPKDAVPASRVQPEQSSPLTPACLPERRGGAWAESARYCFRAQSARAADGCRNSRSSSKPVVRVAVTWALALVARLSRKPVGERGRRQRVDLDEGRAFRRPI
jgi:hypothetical protein